jgi:hypothetical protein
MTDRQPPDHLLCPSAQPNQAEAVTIGIVGGEPSAPRVSYLRPSLPVVPELLALAAPVEPTEVFRFAAPCAESACQHFEANDCTLAQKIASLVEGRDHGVPACAIRPRCRWWNQEGTAACRQCPMIVTRSFVPSPELRDAADPVTRRAGQRVAAVSS